MLEKLKVLITDDQVFTSLLVVLVAVASFGLGRASVTPVTHDIGTDSQPDALADRVRVYEAVPATVSATTPPAHGGTDVQEEGEVVASKTGTKYHLPSCSGARTIKLENRIMFPTRAAAEAAGYAPAANCPGL
jgi:hypothetical protein